MKKLHCLSVMLVLVLLMGLWYIPGIAEEEQIWTGDFEYRVLDDGTAEITDYSGRTSDLTIPAVLDGKVVTSIGDEAFMACRSLSSIVLPDSVASIGSNPFVRCFELQRIHVSPDNPAIASIDGVLFRKTDKRLICYPAGRKNTEYIVPKGIISICDGAFAYCASLSSIVLPDGLTSIGDEAFYNCYSLSSIVLPDSVASIGSNLFVRCSALQQIHVSPDNPAIAIIDGVLFSKADNRLICYPAGSKNTRYSVPEGITSIGDGAFYGCGSLSSIVLPDGLTSIGDEAFAYCNSLSSIVLPDGPMNIGNDAFSYSPYLTLTVPRDSYARQYAKENGINFTYPDALDWLNN